MNTMDKLNISQHISQQFNTELEEVRSKVLAMGGLVEQQLTDAMTALVEGDGALAEQVMTNDYRVNALEVEIDEECTHILARRQPAATDLRLVMAVIKTIADLERIGDEAERVGRMAEHLAGSDLKPSLLGEIEHMGDMVRRMLHQALDALARTDVELGLGVLHDDRKVDAKYESLTRQVITYMAEDPRVIPMTLNLLWASRSLERIGDRSRNICEYVIYLVRGKDVRHTSLEQIEAEARRER
jgi:phosphate transport system protein